MNETLFLREFQKKIAYLRLKINNDAYTKEEILRNLKNTNKFFVFLIETKKYFVSIN